jgi:RNA polymerase subunit RPABC4/transcription elongation factor Spt4
MDMPEVPDLTEILATLGLIGQVLFWVVGAYFVAFWFSLIVWTFRDVRARSRDLFTQLLGALLVLPPPPLNLGGLMLYVILRPRETLAEMYERSLEEEALLQGIEDVDVCPACKQLIEPDYSICPNCFTQLKRKCPDCGCLMELSWSVCAYCGSQSAQQPLPVSRPEGIALEQDREPQ